MKVINFILKYLEYTLPFIGIILTGIGFRLSSILLPIQEYFSDELQLEFDLAFNILVLFIIKNIINIKDYYTVEANLSNPNNSKNHLTLEKITDNPHSPQIVNLYVQIVNANHIKGEIYLEIRYARNIELALDHKPEELIYNHDHKDRSIVINLSTLFNFSLKQYQKDMLRFKVLSNSIEEAYSSIELYVNPSKLFDKLKIKEDIQNMKVNIK